MPLTKNKNSTDQVYKTVAAMKATTAPLGDHVRTLGYYASGDGGAAQYIVKAAADYSGSPDELGDHTLADGKIAVLQTDCPINPKIFGARGNGTTDDTASLVATDGMGPIKLQAGTYRVASNTTFTNEVTHSSDGSFILDSGVTATLSGNFDNISVRLFGASGEESEPDASKGIQNALDSGVSNVVVPSGVYNIQTTLRIPSNVSLIANKDTEFRRNAVISALIINDSDETTGGYTANNNISIIGGKWTTNASDFPLTACTPISFIHTANLTISGAEINDVLEGSGISVIGCTDVLIDHCSILDGYDVSESYGIGLAHAANSTIFPYFGPYDNTIVKNVTIKDCLFKNISHGVKTLASSSSDYPTNVNIINNTFEDINNFGLELSNCTDLKIEHNTIKDSAVGASIVSGFSADNKSILISNNYISNVNKTGSNNGIYVSGYSLSSKNLTDVRVLGNFVNDAGAKGIEIRWVQNAVVLGNTVTGCDTSGIHVFGSADFAVSNNITRTNNVTSTAGEYDLNIGMTGAIEITHGTVIGNVVDTGNISYCNRVVGRNNTFFTSLNNVSNTLSAVAENLVNGVFI